MLNEWQQFTDVTRFGYIISNRVSIHFTFHRIVCDVAVARPPPTSAPAGIGGSICII